MKTMSSTKDLIQNFLRVRDQQKARPSPQSKPRKTPVKSRGVSWSRVSKTPVSSEEKTLPAIRGTTESTLERSPQTALVDTYQPKVVRSGVVTLQGTTKKRVRVKPEEHSVIARSKALVEDGTFLSEKLEDTLRAFRRSIRGEPMTRRARRSLEGRLRVNWARQHGLHPEGPTPFTDAYLDGNLDGEDPNNPPTE